jgi:N-acetylmuramoyl-L-alanine amidase
MHNNIKVIDFYKGKVYINEVESEYENELGSDIEIEINKNHTSIEDKSEIEMCVNEDCLCSVPNGEADLNMSENSNQVTEEEELDIDTNGSDILDQTDRSEDIVDENTNTNQNTDTNQNSNGNSTTNGNNNRLGTVYKVQVGVYQSFSNALNSLASFMQMGYSGVVIPYRNLYAVQLGEFNDLDDAAEFEKELRANGFDTLLVRVGSN